MEETRLKDFDSFYLGSIGRAATESFYRSERKTKKPSLVNKTIFSFTLSLNQRMVTYTRYSVTNVLQNVPVLLLTILRFMTTSSAGFSRFNFKLTAITNMYSAMVRKDS